MSTTASLEPGPRLRTEEKGRRIFGVGLRGDWRVGGLD